MDLLILHRHRRGPVAGIGRRAPVRALGLALAVVLMATLISPLTGSATADEPATTDETAAAQDDGEGGAVDEGGTADEGGQGDGGDASATETPDAGLTTLQSDPLTSGIHVNMHACDRDHGSDFLQWSANCTPGGGFSFDVYGGGVLQQSAVDYFTTTGLPAGSYTIREWIPQGYREPTVFCSRGPSNGNGAGQVEVVTYQGYYEFSLGANEAIYCHWFNMPLRIAPDGVGNIWLYKRPCPANPGFDYYTADINTFYNLCDLYGGDEVSYSLYSHVSGLTDYRSINHEFDSFIWKEVPAGQVTITESGWDYDGYGPPLIYCTNLYPGAPAWFKPDVHDVYASFFIPAEVGTACHWFTIPLAEDGDAADAEQGELSIYAYDCPADEALDYGAADADDLRESCARYFDDDINFDLYNADTGQQTTTKINPLGTGTANFSQVDGGSVWIEQSAREGYGYPIVSCGVYNGVDYDPLAIEAIEWAVGFEFPAGEEVVCHWFSIPAAPDGSPHGDHGSVTVDKHNCPEVDEHADLEWYRETCDEPGDGIYFKLDGASTGNPGDFPTDADGEVSWTEREADRYYLYEELPTGYGEPVVFCGAEGHVERYDVEYTPDADPFTYRIQFDLAEGEHLVCSWYNVPTADDGGIPAAGNGSVAVATYTCPEGTDLAHDAVDWYRQHCPQPAEGVSFTLKGPGYEILGEYLTDANGEAAWTGLAADAQHILAEELPTGYGTPAVFCDRSRPQDGEQPRYVRYGVSVEEAIWFYPAEGEALHCEWFNIPIGDDTATATITMHTCPTGYDAAGADYFDLAEHCQGYEDGLRFYAYTGQGTMVDVQDTGDSFDFGVRFVGLPATEVVISQPGLYGYGRPIVYCGVTDQQGTGSATQQATVTLGDATYAFDYYIAQTLNAGDTLSCDWFNVPLINSPDAGTLTIYKYVCKENGTDYYAADADTIDRNCESYFDDDVAFDYYNHTSGETETQHTAHVGQNNSATVVWAPTPAGPVTVTEHAWEGYGTPIVSCYAADEDGDGDEIAVEVEGWSADFAIPAGQHVVCLWFNIPDGLETGNVMIYTYFCPDDPSFDYYAAEEEDLAPSDGRCAFYDGDKVGFDLTGRASGETETQYTNPGNGYGAFWSSAPAGEVTITEHAQSGYGVPRVFCGISHDTAFEYVPIEVEGRSVDVDVPAGKTVICFWFNIPELDSDPAKDDGAPAEIETRCTGRHTATLNHALCGGDRSGRDVAAVLPRAVESIGVA